jgi:hypothetical protein
MSSPGWALKAEAPAKTAAAVGSNATFQLTGTKEKSSSRDFLLAIKRLIIY